MQDGKLTYTIHEAASLLGISTQQCYMLSRAGKLPAFKLGGKWIIPKEALHNLLESVNVT
jgi:excisionase family DNA binding protein